ncbi:MAG: HAMP domain-containing sensor histidine kinase [bacterium]
MSLPVARSQPAALLALAIVLVVLSSALELASTARLATQRAATECELSSRAVRRQLDFLVRERPGAPLDSLAADPRVGLVLADAVVQASSILYVAVCDTNGVAVAHSLASEIGKHVDRHPPLPSAKNLAESFAVAWSLSSPGPLYSYDTPLVVNERPFATIRAVVTRTFLWENMKEALRHGLLIAIVVFFVAVGLGVALSRVAVGRVRVLEAGVTAIREGRFDTAIPESGAEEFRRLTRELNLLGEQYRRERGAPAPRSPSSSGGGSLPKDAGERSRVLMRLGEMATGVAHELRDPLQTLSLDLDAVRVAAKGHPDVDLHVRRALGKVQQLDRAIRGFLAIARLRPPSSEPVDVAGVVREIHDDLEPDANLAGLELEREGEAGELRTSGDREVLRQALRNLVRNSIQALPSHDGRIVLRTGQDGDRIYVSVCDTGPGMPPETLEKAFDLFYTTKEEGTGVGLALVRQAVELHGGDVEVRSRLGEGTVVTMRLPALRS